MDSGEAINTLTFTEHGGITLLSLLMRFPSQEARDGAIATGMNDGIEMGYARLEAQLAAEGKR